MYTFNKMWGVVTPEEAEAKIEEQKKEAGIKGTMDLAKKLEHIVLFEKGKHEKGVLALKSINTEIINLRKEFQEKEEQVKIKK